VGPFLLCGCLFFLFFWGILIVVDSYPFGLLRLDKVGGIRIRITEL